MLAAMPHRSPHHFPLPSPRLAAPSRAPPSRLLPSPAARCPRWCPHRGGPVSPGAIPSAAPACVLCIPMESSLSMFSFSMVGCFLAYWLCLFLQIVCHCRIMAVLVPYFLLCAPYLRRFLSHGQLFDSIHVGPAASGLRVSWFSLSLLCQYRGS